MLGADSVEVLEVGGVAVTSDPACVNTDISGTSCPMSGCHDNRMYLVAHWRAFSLVSLHPAMHSGSDQLRT